MTNLSKAKFDTFGVKGLPEDYPVPPYSDMSLFYIQRNLNKNTVVYELNTNSDGRVNELSPMRVFWIKYSQSGERVALNKFQNKLAYGYNSSKITEDLYEFNMVSYDKLKFYLAFDHLEAKYRIVTNIQGKKSYLSNIYVFAEELGLFPDVKYFELYGEDIKTGIFSYQKIML